MGLLDNLVNSVNQGIGKAMEKVNAAAQEANAKAEAEGKPLTEEEKEKQAQALDALKGLGGMFSGAVEMAKKEMQAEVEAKAAAEAAIFDGWEERFPYYPKWDVGGDHFELEEMDPMNGHPSWRFCLRGRPFLVELYAQKLRAAGFVAKGNDPMDLNADTYYKLVDGVCYAWNRTDACGDGYINVRTSTWNPSPSSRRPPPNPPPPRSPKASRRASSRNSSNSLPLSSLFSSGVDGGPWDGTPSAEKGVK